MAAQQDPLIERLAGVLRRGPALRLAVLFGSMAKGTDRPDSDVDVAVLPAADGWTTDGELDLAAELSRAAGREVDLVRLDRATTLLRAQIARDGVPILAAGPFEFARFRAQATAEYLDFAPVFAHHAERFRRRLAEGDGR